jgi:hypothetical protein
MKRTSRWKERGMVAVTSLAQLSDRQLEDLTSFAGFCAARLERHLERSPKWSATLVRRGRRAHAIVRVDAQIETATITARGSSSDFAFAIWEAMCRVEQPLLELARQGELSART